MAAEFTRYKSYPCHPYPGKGRSRAPFPNEDLDLFSQLRGNPTAVRTDLVMQLIGRPAYLDLGLAQ